MFLLNLIISIVKNEERKEPLSDHEATVFKVPLLVIVEGNQERPEKSGGPLRRAVPTYGSIAASVADLCSTEADLVAIGIQHSLR